MSLVDFTGKSMRQVAALLAVGLAFAIGSALSAHAQAVVPALITQPIDEASRASLPANTRPEAKSATDLGAVPDNYPMPHMLLQLKRSPERQQALERTIEALHDPASPTFHQWLDPTDIGAQFGLSAADRQAVAGWLVGYGFTVNVVYDNGVLIDFSGAAGQVRAAFQTEIHALNVGGKTHIGNMTDPTIPAALAPAVEGVLGLHDFKPHTMKKSRPAYTFGCSDGTCAHALVPADLATIYDLKAAFAAGFTGKGETVVVIEDTNVFNPANWTTFRKTFGLNAYAFGKFVQAHPAPPSGANNCQNPGVNGDEDEAILDAEWASAAAPNATIELASCSNTPDGLIIAFQNIIAAKTHPSIISISYGECEAGNGATSNAAYKAAYEQAVAEGVSVFVSAGDENAASCDAGLDVSTHGIGVSALASTIYNVAVGGTDFADAYDGTSKTYWATTNTATYGSAKAYIPEIPWNGSCASNLIAKFLGYSVTYGTKGFCSSATAKDDGFLEVVGGSGGPSGCATGEPSFAWEVSGTCKGYAKPSWQTLVGNPKDGVRDIPDVSLFASNGIWDAYYVFCDSDEADGGSCSGAPSNWSGAGGTSFSSPILAGIQALVNQHMGKPQGNPNPVYYRLARTQFNSSGAASCRPVKGTAPASTCVFYNVVRGDIDVNCQGKVDCYLPSGTQGVLSTKDSAFAIAYGTTTAWNFSTGIGSLNAYNLVTKWSTGLAIAAAAAGP